MPEYLPALNLPTGMAEKLIDAKSRINDPWAALAQNLGQTVNQSIGQYAARKANAPLTPEQIAAVQKGQVPTGLTREQGLSLAEKQAASRAALGKTIVPVTDSVREVYKLAGHTLNPEDTQVSAREFDAFSKLAQGSVKDHTAATADLLKNYPGLAKMGYQEGDRIPNRFISEQSKPTTGASLKDAQFKERNWINLGKELDLSKASSRTPLGVAVTNNQKAGRAMDLLNRKGTYTPQDQSLITTDLTAMMKGGSPDEELLRQQQYGSLYSNGVSLLQRISSSPQDLNVPEVRQHLKEVIQGIVKVDNQAIKGHLESLEDTYQDVIKARPKDWEKAKAKAYKAIHEDSASSTSGGPDDAALQSAIDKL